MPDRVRVLNTQAATIMLPDGINVTIDPVADVLYIRFSMGRVERTREDREGVLIDFGERGNVIGMSILHPKKVSLERRRVLKRLANRFSIPGLAAIHPEYLAKGYTPGSIAAHA